MLRIENLSFLDWENVSLEVAVGEVLVVLGESGSGKSLLLRSVADLIPHTGEIYLDDVACSEIEPTKWRRDVGFLSAEALWWRDRVREHFLEVVSKDRLSKLGLDPDCMNWEVSRLSMGERQRLGILRILDRKPRVLLLDEPTSNLDPKSSEAVESLLIEYIRENDACSIWVTHDEKQAEKFGGRLFRMSQKRLEEV